LEDVITLSNSQSSNPQAMSNPSHHNDKVR